MNEGTPKNLSIREAAKVYGLTESWLYKKSMERSIPLIKAGSRCLIPVKEFEAWLNSNRVDGRKGDPR